jgi:uncharacterized lipoprotein YbaY/heat shock protein HslJ
MIRVYLGFLLCGAALTACAMTPRVKPTREPDGLLSGTATYREEVAIPRDAVLEVWLKDASPNAFAAPIVAETAVLADGRQVPLPFELKYERSRILPDRPYTVEAVIRNAGEILFATDTGQPVITKSNPTEVELVLVRPRTEIAPPRGVLEGTSWRLEDLGGAGVLDKIEATLEFTEGGKIAGQGSCNRFFGTAAVSGTTIKLGPVGATLMACADAAMDQEKRYFDALNNAERFAVEGSVLQIFFKGNDKPLRFVRKGVGSI